MLNQSEIIERLEENPQSLSVEECRNILGPNYSDLTDLEVDQLRIGMEILADLTIQSYKQKKTVEKSKKEES